MNNAIDELIKRLLQLYPVKNVKEYFALKGNFDDIIPDIVKNHSHKSIFSFAAVNMNYTRQHVYIFNLSPSFKAVEFDTTHFPLAIKDSSIQNGELSINCLPQVDFDITAIKPFEETELHFFQPVKIRAFKKHLIIQVTTLEKNLSSFLAAGRKVVDSVRNNGEDTWLPKIINFFNKQKYKTNVCDIHKGVKKMWEDKIIDSKYVKSLGAKSTSTEAMHEAFTVREVFPDKYKEIIKSPLLKTLFVYKGADDKLADHFHSDPGDGLVIFSAFPKNLAQIENVINEIIKHN
jgi:hypothetical protein